MVFVMIVGSEIRKCVDEEWYIRTWIQRAAGWCETAERTSGTRLGAAVPNLLLIQERVDADGFPAVMRGRI